MVSTIVDLHDRLATTLLLFMTAVGFWGLFGFFKGQALNGSIAGAFVIGQVLAMVQVGFGLVLYLKGFRPESSVHMLYGITAILALPFVWSYARERAPRQSLLFYSLVALFIAGLATRAMATGG